MEARQLMEQAGPLAAGSMLDESINQQIIRKWSAMDMPGGRINFLAGVEPRRAAVLARCLENQAQFMTRLNEDTLSTNSGSFQKYIFPVVRRLFPNLVLNDIATVQPMTGPQGAMFTMEYRYDDRKGAKLPWGGIANQPYAMNYDGQVNAGDDAIKNFAVNYASEYNEYDAVCTDTAAVNNLTNLSANCRLPKWGPIRAPGTSGQRTFSVLAIYRVTDGAAPGGAYTATATLDPTGVTTNLVDQYSHTVGTFDVTTGAWSISPELIAGGAAPFVVHTVVYLQYYINSELTYTVSGNKIPSMSLNLTSYPIVAEPSRLRAQWSLDAAQDLRSQFGMDLEAEMVNGIANEIALEIDRKGINMMIAQAAHRSTYTYSATIPGDMEEIHNLMTMVDSVSARISRSGMRGPASFIVASPEACALMGQLGAHNDWSKSIDLQTAASHGDRNTNYPIKRLGTVVNGRYTVYENPWQDPAVVLVGYKGQTWLDAGLGFAPYIPLYATDTFTDPDTLMVKKGMASRYALKMLRTEYYGTVTITGLPTVTSTLV